MLAEPRQKVRDIIMEPFCESQPGVVPDLAERALALLAKGWLGAEHLDRYPHQFSGGQRQRIALPGAVRPAGPDHRG